MRESPAVVTCKAGSWDCKDGLLGSGGWAGPMGTNGSSLIARDRAGALESTSHSLEVLDIRDRECIICENLEDRERLRDFLLGISDLAATSELSPVSNSLFDRCSVFGFKGDCETRFMARLIAGVEGGTGVRGMPVTYLQNVAIARKQYLAGVVKEKRTGKTCAASIRVNIISNLQMLPLAITEV